MSTLVIVLLAVAYTAVGAGFTRATAGHLAYAWRNTEHARDRVRYPAITPKTPPPPSNDQWIGGLLVGLLVGVIWPLVPLALLPTFKVGAERRELERRQAERIADLERQLGVER
ncbi:hypothetical protein [Patulibacter defluvii]|uniref:hypothetical protein n=1 Tax=Patulibacter defluvii TaxID=3095358 RepID=UPI002A75A3E4|nr:hypothetical protein [Patulibacter sp. DM4]